MPMNKKEETMNRFIAYVITLLFGTALSGIAFIFFCHKFAPEWLDENRFSITCFAIAIAMTPWIYSIWKINKDPSKWM